MIIVLALMIHFKWYTWTKWSDHKSNCRFCNFYWKLFVSFRLCFFFSGLIVFLLMTILISCLMSSYSFSALTVNFNDNCVTGAALAFKRLQLADEALTNHAKQDAEFYGKKFIELDKEFRSYYLAKELRVADETGAIPKTQIYQFLNSKTNSIWEAPKQTNQTSYMVPTLPSNDTEFFKNCKFNSLKVCSVVLFFEEKGR